MYFKKKLFLNLIYIVIVFVAITNCSSRNSIGVTSQILSEYANSEILIKYRRIDSGPEYVINYLYLKKGFGKEVKNKVLEIIKDFNLEQNKEFFVILNEKEDLDVVIWKYKKK